MRRGERIQCRPRLRPPAILDVVDQRDQPRGERRRDAMLLADRDDRADLGIDLGAPPAHREVAPDAAVGLGGPAVEGDHVGERARERIGGRAGGERGRVEAVERLEADPLGGSDRRDLLAERREHRPVTPGVEHIRDRIVGQRGREQERAVDQLAPQIAPDVGGQDRVVIEGTEQPVDGLDARAAAAVELAHHHRAPAAVHAPARAHGSRRRS